MKGTFKNNLYEKEGQDRQLDWKTASKLFKYVRPYKTLLVLTIFLLLITALLQIAGPYLIKVAIDNYITPGKLDGLLYIVLLYGAIILVEFLIRYFQQYMTEYLGQKIMYDMRMDIFNHVHKMEMSFFDKNPVGRVLTRITTDVQALNEMLSSGIVTLFGDIFMIVGVMVVMISLNLKLSLVTFSVLILLAAATVIFRKIYYIRVS